MAARWTALLFAVIVWGAVLVLFTVRIARFLLARTSERAIGESILKVVAFVCLVLLYLGSPFGQDIVFFLAYRLISPDRGLHLDWPLYSWISPSIGIVSLVVTMLLFRRRPSHDVLQIHTRA